MSKLLGIINPNADPNDQFARWLWRATEIPWEYEQLNVEKMEVESGNIQFRVLGPHTPRYPDGVFIKLQINKDLNPEIATSGEGSHIASQAALIECRTDAVNAQAAVIVPTEAPVTELNVATTERLPGESSAANCRRKAIALRWQASKLDKLAEDMEALAAQGLI